MYALCGEFSLAYGVLHLSTAEVSKSTTMHTPIQLWIIYPPPLFPVPLPAGMDAWLALFVSLLMPLSVYDGLTQPRLSIAWHLAKAPQRTYVLLRRRYIHGQSPA